jgi:hypothetical protein
VDLDRDVEKELDPDRIAASFAEYDKVMADPSMRHARMLRARWDYVREYFAAHLRPPRLGHRSFPALHLTRSHRSRRLPAADVR